MASDADKALYFKNSAEAKAKEGDYKGAIKDYNEAIALDYDNLQTYKGARDICMREFYG